MKKSVNNFVILKRNGDAYLIPSREEVSCLCPPPQRGNSQGTNFYLGKISYTVSRNFRSL